MSDVSGTAGVRRLRVGGDVFDALAAGDGAIVDTLRSGQRSKRLLLLHEVVSTAATRASDLFATASTEEAYAVLAEAQRRDRPATEPVLFQPHVGAWAMTCLRRLSADDRLPPEDIGHLGAIAAAAALRAGYSFEVTAYVRDRSVALPTYGAARVPGPDGWCRLRSGRGGPGDDDVEIEGPGGTFTIPVRSASATATWWPLRRLGATKDGITFDVLLEDLDPYRSCGRLPVAPRLDDEAVRAWQRVLDATWPLLVDDDRARAEAIAAGVASIVPLLATEADAELSASCHEAVGAVAMTPPSNALALALALVHEHQHNKLSALLDLVPLLTPSAEARHRAPWRPDPRPLHGLVQGTYAFLGLTRFWESVRRNSRPWDPDVAEDWAHFEFALGRRQVTTAVDTLLGSGHLSGPGTRFLRRMDDELTELHRLDVPPVAEESAELVARDHALAWRLRNCRPDGGQIDAWATSWLSEQACVWHDVPTSDVADGGVRIASTTRQTLVRHHLAHPDSWRRRVEGASEGDLALVAGDLTRAADLYEKQIEEDPDDHASWAGLALARRDEGTAAAWALTCHPELVCALHRAVLRRRDWQPSATTIAEWLGRGAPAARRPPSA